MVSQTTQTPERFGEVVGKIAESAKEVVAFNTICYATHDRQTAARELAPQVDAMFVVGGRNSANTNRLAEICSAQGVPTYHIETAAEIDEMWVRGMQTVGLTAGASTPGWIIDEVRDRLERLQWRGVSGVQSRNQVQVSGDIDRSLQISYLEDFGG